MPLYEYKCELCKVEEEKSRKIDERDEPILCPVCGVDMERILITSGASHTWKVDVWEHIDIHPIEIRSKKHLKEECEKRGVISTGYM